MKKKIFSTFYFKLSTLFIFSIIVDYFWLNYTNSGIGWDQGYHLSNIFKMYNIYNFYNDNYQNLWTNLLKVTDSYRGPLTYFLSSIFLKIFGVSYKNSYLSNHIFNLICIYSIFELGKIIFNKSVGLWAAIIFTFSPLIFAHRTDYLIDLSLTAFCTLTFLFITKWLLAKGKIISIYSLLTGLSFGFIFLVKPTGIVLLVLPFLVVVSLRIYNSKNKFLTLVELTLFFSSFLLIIYPWFSKNWLTIISSIVNAWQWGIKYQQGFEISDLSSWFFYVFRVPNITGQTFFWILSTIFLYRFFYIKSDPVFAIKTSKKINILYLSFFFNVFLITALMSTKEIRFFLPIYPIICIYFSLVLNFKNKFKEIFFKKIALIALIISLITYQFQLGGFFKGFKVEPNKKEAYRLRKEIINEITTGNENLVSTLAVMPDTKEINTFNLEAEASKKGEYVAVRQIISDKETYRFDLENFDWFLIKTGKQGIMKNSARFLIQEELNNDNNFITHKKWQLPDKSYLRLIKRNSPTVIVKKVFCSNKKPLINFKPISNGLKLTIVGEGKKLESSKILLDIKSNTNITKENISTANGMLHPNFNKNDCYSIEQNSPIKIDPNIKQLKINYTFVDNSGEKFTKENLYLDNFYTNKDGELMANKIKKVEELGLYLKNGEFDKLFKLVEALNQSDPKQVYLNDAEDIYNLRYEKDNNEDNLYSILISQILQREVKKAKNTSEILTQNNMNQNQNIYITKAVINLYLFNIKEAKLSINKAKLFKENTKNDSIIKTIDKILNILEFKFV